MAKRRTGKHQKAANAATIIAVFVIALSLIVTNRLGLWEREDASASSGPVSQAVPGGELQVWYLDVGQGDSELIRIPGESGYFNVLIDTGEYEYADGLTSFLQGQGIERIDVLVATHPHADHMGCMARIVQRFEIGSLYMPLLPEEQTPTTAAYEKLLDAASEKGLVIGELHRGAYLEASSEADFQVLAPEKGAEWESVNNYSAVIRLTYGDTSFLFTGDAEKESEKLILEHGDDLSADVLKCGHHGSKTSTSAKFLKAVNPRWAVISCGAGNQYGHPHDGTLEKLEKLDCEVFRTDEDGTVLAVSDGTKIEFETGLDSIVPKE